MRLVGVVADPQTLRLCAEILRSEARRHIRENTDYHRTRAEELRAQASRFTRMAREAKR